MKRIDIAIFCLFAVFFVSCRSELDLQHPETRNWKSMEFTARMESFSPATKTSLQGSPGDDIRELYWTPGDSIAVRYPWYGEDSPYGAFVNVNKEASPEATFKGEFANNESAVTAFYPLKMVRNGNFNYPLFPSVQKYCENGIAPDTFPMVAYNSSTDDKIFHFKNLCGILAFRLTGEVEVKSITFSSKDRLVSGFMSYGKTDRDNPYMSIQSDRGDAARYVTLDCTDVDGRGVMLSKNEPKWFHIVLPPQSYFGGFSLDIKTNMGHAYASNDKELEIKRSERTTVDVDVPYEFHPEDLSTTETANSYIVPEEGYYRIKAVKGNSKESVGAVADASVLWESSGFGDVPAKGSIVENARYEDGYIYFNSHGEGNALIAALDASGNVLWSWHIWSCRGYDPMAVQQIYSGKPIYMMDRNLGAMSAVKGDPSAVGLFYQWGRKDPFTFAGTRFPDGSESWPATVKSDVQKGTIDYSISHPTVFIGGNSNNWDWCYSGSESSEEDSRWQNEKTIFDPCPAGWKVVPSGMWPDSFGSADNFTEAGLWDAANRGMDFAGKFGTSSSWYPASGLADLEDGSSDKKYTEGYYWTSAIAGSNATCLTFGDSGTVRPQNSIQRAYGLNVRCCRADYIRVDAGGAEDLSSGGTSNSYIVPTLGTRYKFNAKVQGNSSDPVGGNVFRAKVLWETFGNDVQPQEGDVITDVGYSEDGYVAFKAVRNGNAVVALTDEYNKVLWSWHLWVCEGYDPAVTQQQYYCGAVMMDRNLGATNATPGDIGAVGLLYQWGRKDPFPGMGVYNNSSFAKSTAEFGTVYSSTETGTKEYAVAHPMQFITSDWRSWLYEYVPEEDSKLWGDGTKTKFDPCPPGWCVPKGGSEGVFAQSLNTDQEFTHNAWDWSNHGADMGGLLAPGSGIWYPATGFIRSSTSDFQLVDFNAAYMHSSSTVSGSNVSLMYLYSGWGYPNWSTNNANANAVRCCREGYVPVTRQYTDLSAAEKANSYIVSKTDAYYKLDATKPGNGSSVIPGRDEDYLKNNAGWAEVLWESEGTSAVSERGTVISELQYIDGFIRFKALRSGNAVIGLKRSGTVRWSWHIWVSEGYDPAATQQEYGNAGIMMDRNLGATASAPGTAGSNGLYYQWGRKDPFLGTGYEVYPSTTAASEWSNSLSYSIIHPATLLQADGASGGWFSSIDGTVEENYWTKSKSIFDPCPPGWKIPEGGEKGLWAKSGLGFSAYDSANKGYLFGESAWYPADSYISGTDGTVNAGETFYPSSSPDSGTGKISGLMLTPSEASLTYGGINKADAVPVRCCKIGYVPKPDATDAINLSDGETANCYIANQKGKTYKFYALKKGNGDNSLDGTPVKAEVLWESFGTLEVLERGDVIASEAVLGTDGYVTFTSGRDGNAVIAVKDASDNILWSWHIWVCEGYDPVATQQVYYNNAGTMMDRNLGALGARPEDLATEGLLYQWGRKDPFPNSCMIPNGNGYTQGEIKMTQKLTAPVISDSVTGTVEYAVSHPTSIIGSGNSNHWLYSPDGNTPQDHLWDEAKTIYDPCPPGWKVPESGDDGVWNTAAGKPDSNNIDSRPYSTRYDENHLKGLNLSGLLGDAPMIWYPLAGFIEPHFNGINEITIGHLNLNWSAYYWGWNINSSFSTYYEDYIYLRTWESLSSATSVRCQKIE